MLLDHATPALTGSVAHYGANPATTDNFVSVPARTLMNLGARYQFKLAGKLATLRVTAANVPNADGFDFRGYGTFDLIAGRVIGGYMTVDL